MSDEQANGMHDDLPPLHDPRHVAVNARDVMRPCGWAKSKGFQNLKDRDLVAPPVLTHPDRWRLARFLRPLHASDAHIPLRTSAPAQPDAMPGDSDGVARFDALLAADQVAPWLAPAEDQPGTRTDSLAGPGMRD